MSEAPLPDLAREPEFRPHRSAPAGAALPGADPLSLTAQLCFALYSTSRSMTAAYRPFLDEMRVTYPQYLALLALWERPGMTMRELGEKLHLDYGTVSPLIQRLQAHGLVESVRSAHDRRAVELRATEAGRALQRQARRMVESVLAEVDYPLDRVIALRDEVKALGRRLDAITADRQHAAELSALAPERLRPPAVAGARG
ncbi:MarR family winged helix-turn-helix transcriptional regulator [Nocardia asteroides]|uniref:MarR family winged helix-turn-helix transcriptional regulator n=1 Tax=Nocardia asteroides TaxID=1824 RepID=UPI001E324315|nr:MarR family transcriptional regulator [Nocardia asteroides]UGT61477.1 MarR family transcriptional regulator [Nocardia asteroides]